MLEKCVLTILELNWKQRLGHKKTKLNIIFVIICSRRPHNCKKGHFTFVERTRTSSKCQKMKYARAKRAKIPFFIVKYANLWGFCCRRRCGCFRCYSKCESAPDHDGMVRTLDLNSGDPEFSIPALITSWICFR